MLDFHPTAKLAWPRQAPPALQTAKGGSVVALRARRAALSADAALRQQFAAAGLTVSQVLKLGHTLQGVHGPISLAQVLPLLPPKLAARIVQNQSEALLKMLLAWGESLRQQAALAKKAQLRRQARAQEVQGHIKAQEAQQVVVQRQLQAAQTRSREALVAKRADQIADFSDVSPAAHRLSLGSQSLVSGLNRPMMEALHAPMAMGIALRGATLRLSSLA